MAYRRKQVGITRASTFKEDIYNQSPDHDDHSDLKGHINGGSFRSSQSFPSRSSLAAQAIRASSRVQGFTAYEDKNETRSFWGILAQKAKSILEEDEEQKQQPQENNVVTESTNPTIRKSIDKIKTSLNQIKRKGSDLIDSDNNQSSGSNSPWQPLTQQPNQLKASRDLAKATAAKAKLLLRELKTVKSNLAFTKERCGQLEEENKRLRDNRATEKGNNNNPADDDLIRLQLETLLAEKARLAHENSIYARENRFLREIVEFHQLTMQNIVYIDEEGIEDVAEVNPEITITLSMMVENSISPTPSSTGSSPSRGSVSMEFYPVLVQQSDVMVESPKLVRPLSLGFVGDGKRPSTQLSV